MYWFSEESLVYINTCSVTECLVEEILNVKITYHIFLIFFSCHIWKLIHGPLGKARTIIRPFSLDISAIGFMKVSNSFPLIAPPWFSCKAVNLFTGDPQPTGSLCWHLQQWLECHCFPILCCHSGSTQNAFYLILQLNMHLQARILALPSERHRPLKQDLFWISTLMLPCFSAWCHSVIFLVMETKTNWSFCTQ